MKEDKCNICKRTFLYGGRFFYDSESNMLCPVCYDTESLKYFQDKVMPKIYNDVYTGGREIYKWKQKKKNKIN